MKGSIHALEFKQIPLIGRDKVEARKIKDCAIRSISVLTGQPYKDVHKDMKGEMVRLFNEGEIQEDSKYFRRGLDPRYGGHWPTILATIPKYGLKSEKLERRMSLERLHKKYGNCVAIIPRHALAIIDECVHDVWDSRWKRTRWRILADGSKERDMKPSQASHVIYPKDREIKEVVKNPGRSKNFNSGDLLVPMCSFNPRRKGTWGHRSYEILLQFPAGCTYEDFRAKGGRPNDLKWDIERSRVAIKKEGTWQIP